MRLAVAGTTGNFVPIGESANVSVSAANMGGAINSGAARGYLVATLEIADSTGQELRTIPGHVPIVARTFIVTSALGSDSAGFTTFALPENYAAWRWLTIGTWDTDGDEWSVRSIPTVLLHAQRAAATTDVTISGNPGNNGAMRLRFTTATRSFAQVGTNNLRVIYAELHN